MESRILISIVTHNDSLVLGRCLEALGRLETGVRIKIWDNASEDGSVEVAGRFGVEVTASRENLGYCGGHNRNFRGERFDYVFFMNADVVLESDFFTRLLPVFERFPGAGMATGKLLRMDERGDLIEEGGLPVIDSAGIIFHRNMRHFDRGGGEPDDGQYDETEPVFGGTGAALLCSREAVECLSCLGEFWDEDFFAFREDADLAWRARLLGWEVIYEPRARALHKRHVRPDNRRELDPLINMHSVKNRFLMRAKNIDWRLRLHCFPSYLVRDAGILAYILLRERSSMEAFRILWRIRSRTREKRKKIQSRKTVSGGCLAKWFL